MMGKTAHIFEVSQNYDTQGVSDFTMLLDTYSDYTQNQIFCWLYIAY